MLSVKSGVPATTALVKPGTGDYIAIRSIPGTRPELPWTLFATREDPTLAADEVVVGSDLGAYAQPKRAIDVRRVEATELSHVILTAPAPIYAELEARKDELAEELPAIVRQGDYLDSLRCRVRACEPVDQGRIQKRKTVVSVVCGAEGSSADADNKEPLDLTDVDIEISSFLQADTDSIELSVEPLQTPMLPKDVQPIPAEGADLENSVFVRVDQIARLGIFSGDLVTLKCASQDRIVRVFSYPEPNTISGSVAYLPPLLAYNLGEPKTITLDRPSGVLTVPVAKDVTISRIASPISTNRTYQQAFLSALRSYFETGPRIVRQGDVLAVPIDTVLAQTLFQAGTHPEEEQPLSLSGKANNVVWFKITALGGGSEQCVISPTQTRMVQSGLTTEKCVPSRLGWHKYYGIPTLPDLFADPELFAHARQLQKLIRASLAPQAGALSPTILMCSSKRGAGKHTALRAVAADLGVHEMEIDCYQLVGDSDAKTLGALKARMDRALTMPPCLVVLAHLEALGKKNDTDGRDTSLVNGLGDILDEYLGKPGLVLAATCGEADSLADSVRNRFKFEVNVPVLSEGERRAVFGYLLDGVLPPNRLAGKLDDLLTGYTLRGDVQLATLALQSAGLTPPDLESIVRVARQQAYLRSVKSANAVDLVIAQRGVVKLTPQDFEKAIGDARAKYSDSIGAPRIPNVQWKDVGGLENVKGEIMDTIEMPLKYPQLFASGVKKRSGILFYGPPGTGKTLLAKAIATTFSLNFFSVKGPELLNMYIGESEANVRRVFQKARDAKPCVVFFDELDSVAPKRGNQGDSGGVMDRIVSQLLAELDGMSQGADGVFVIGATNRPDLLDEALLRPGRFDKMLYLGVSDTHDKQRTILEALTRKFDLSSEVSLAQVADACPFTFTGADFYALSSDAMLNAMTRTAGEVDAKIAKYNADREAQGQEPITIRAWFQNVAGEQDTHVQVSPADFEKAQRELVPSVSADELAHYVKVRETFEGKADAKPANAKPANAKSAAVKPAVNGSASEPEKEAKRPQKQTSRNGTNGH